MQAKAAAEKKREEEEERERKFGDPDDFIFSVTRKYEKVEINLQKLKAAGCEYALFHVKVPKFDYQLKDSTIFLKKKKNETQQQKLIVKKNPRTTRFLTRIYDKKTKTELCRFVSDLPKVGDFEDGNLDGMVGMLFHDSKKDKWSFRATNAFRPLKPSTFRITVGEAGELPPIRVREQPNPRVTIQFEGREGKQRLLQTKVQKSITPVWNESLRYFFRFFYFLAFANSCFFIKVLISML